MSGDMAVECEPEVFPVSTFPERATGAGGAMARDAFCRGTMVWGRYISGHIRAGNHKNRRFITAGYAGSGQERHYPTPFGAREVFKPTAEAMTTAGAG